MEIESRFVLEENPRVGPEFISPKGRTTMDLALFTRNRLKQLRLSPRNLARATRMTESYIVRLLKPYSPETSNRTHMHDELERVLKLPQGQLAKLANLQRPESDAQTRSPSCESKL